MKCKVGHRVLRVALLSSVVFSTASQAGDPAAAQLGQWSEVQPWPVLAVHAVLMHNGKVVAWDATPDDFDDDPHTAEVKTTRITVWDPISNTHVSADNNTNTDLFCAGAAHMWDGDLLFAGGDDYPGGAPGIAEGATANSNVFHPDNNAWTRLENMASARWYSTVAALPSGEMMTFGGNYQVEPFAEVLGLDRKWRSLPIDSQMPYPYSGDYQWLQVTPSGQVASFGPHNTLGLVDTAGTGRWQSMPNARDTVPYRGYGSFAPYQIGKVLVTGGVGYYQEGPISESSAVVLDLNTMRTEATNDMLYSRSQHNLTVLPDGQVLATGGHGSGEPLIDVSAPVLPSEMWNPDTGVWTEMAALARTRQYHSTGLLLPDARVLVAGGGYCGTCTEFNYHEQNAEIYSPPYLFDANGDPADRPELSGTPERLNYGQSFTFNLQLSGDLERVVLLKPGSTTHSHNQDQRYIKLNFERDAGSVTATAPANRNLAPPGHYLMFAVDENGVPSEGQFILIGQPLLAQGQTVAQSVPQGDLDIFAVESYAGDATLRVSLTNLSADADLYLQKDQYPSGDADGQFVCGSARFGNSDEMCEIDNPGRHTWYVGVSGWQASDYELQVSLVSDASEISGEIDPAKRVAQDGTSSSGGGGSGAVSVWALLLLCFLNARGISRRKARLL